MRRIIIGAASPAPEQSRQMRSVTLRQAQRSSCRSQPSNSVRIERRLRNKESIAAAYAQPKLEGAPLSTPDALRRANAEKSGSCGPIAPVRREILPTSFPLEFNEPHKTTTERIVGQPTILTASATACLVLFVYVAPNSSGHSTLKTNDSSAAGSARNFTEL